MFNWFQKAAGAVGNLFNQGSRYVGSTFNSADRQRKLWEQQARQGAVQAQRQVQQQVQQRAQQVQRQAPKVPQVDFSAVIKQLQALRSQPQVNKALYAANPTNQLKEFNKQVVNPLNQFGQNQVQKAYGINQQQLQDLQRKPLLDRVKFGITRPIELNKQNPAMGIIGSPLNPLGGQAAFQSFNNLNLPKPDLTKMADDASASFARSRVGKNPIVGFAGENIARPIVKSVARYGDVTTGQEKYQPGLKGVSQLGTDVFNIGSTVYTPIRAGKLAQGGKVALKAAPGAFGRGAVAGGGISALNQYSDTGRIDPANVALSALLGGTANVALPVALGGLGRTGSKALAGLRKPEPVAKGYTGNLIDDMNTKFRQGNIDEKQYRAFLVDNFEQQFKRKPMPADIDGYIDVAKNSYNRPYTEAVRARTQAQASGQPQLPVGRRIAQDVPENPLFNEARKYKSAEEFVNSKLPQPVNAKPFLGDTIYKGRLDEILPNSSYAKQHGNAEIVLSNGSGGYYVKDTSSRPRIVLGKDEWVQTAGGQRTPNERGHRAIIHELEHLNQDLNGIAKKSSNDIAEYVTDPLEQSARKAEQNAQTKAQLTDLYNQATKGVESKGKGSDLAEVVYHGTDPKNTDSIMSKGLSATKGRYGSKGDVAYVSSTNNPLLAKYFGNDVVGINTKGMNFLDIKDYARPKYIGHLDQVPENIRPFIADIHATQQGELGLGSAKFRKFLKENGYDGIKMDSVDAIGKQGVSGGKEYRFVDQVPKERIVGVDKTPIEKSNENFRFDQKSTPVVESKGKPIYELAPKPDAQVPVKASGISKSLQKSGSEIYADIPGYIPVKNKALLNISENRVANNERAVIDSIVNRQPNQPITPQMNADSVYLLNKLLKEGRDEEALAIAKATAKNATSAGRAVQILSQLQQTTPEGALVKAQKVVNEVNAKAKKQIATLDAKKQEDIIALANEVQKYKPETRDWQVAAGKLAKYIENLKPVTKGAKVSMVQTMAQLLNPKTAIRNIVGNVGMSGGEDIASIPATLLDKIVSKKTGIRTTAISNPIVGIKGAIKGAKYGIEDTKLGIKTLGGQSKFDVRPDVFKKGVMKKLQNALGYELGVPDKAFYQSAFDKTLDSTMRANKTKTPTAEMLDIANAEALYATFQNNSAIGNALQKTKGVLNLGKDFGAGDFIIKYPKTPGNIVSAGLDYSPVGMAKGITSLARNLNSMTPAVQREAVRNIGRGITGTGAIAMGVILAQNGIITGKKDSDKDIAALDREQGMGPFSFNATALQRFIKGEDTRARPGDVVANYDWMQPAAIQLSMGANAVLNMGKGTDNLIGDALESIGDSANTIVEQPVLQGISRFVNNLNPQYGGGLGKAITDVASGIPSSFVPGSVNQIGQFMDNTARSSYDPNAVNEAVNKVKARIPVLRESLQPSVTTLGQPREQYQNGSNNIFNVFFNPAFIKTIEDNEVRDLVKGIQDRSGETQQAPRVPDKKVRINGQDKQLTAEEYNKYQTYVGQKTNEVFSNLANDPRFNSLSDTDKAKYMSGKLTDINAAAKSELFGNESTAGADRIKTGQLGYETAEDRKARKPKTTKAKKAKKGKVAKAKKGRKGRVAKVAKLPSIRLSAPKKVALAKVAKLRSPKVRYPRLAKSNKTPKIKV